MRKVRARMRLAETGEAEIDGFLTASARYCPFIQQARAAGTIRTFKLAQRDAACAPTYDPKCAAGTAHLELFRDALHGLTHAFLAERSRLDRVPGRLLCYNVLLAGLPENTDHASFLGALHWPLKRDYTKAGLMFGKFWPGEDSHSPKHRQVMPNAPFPLISIRSAQRRGDGRFFSRSADLLQDYISWRASAETDQPLSPPASQPP